MELSYNCSFKVRNVNFFFFIIYTYIIHNIYDMIIFIIYDNVYSPANESNWSVTAA